MSGEVGDHPQAQNSFDLVTVILRLEARGHQNVQENTVFSEIFSV